MEAKTAQIIEYPRNAAARDCAEDPQPAVPCAAANAGGQAAAAPAAPAAPDAAGRPRDFLDGLAGLGLTRELLQRTAKRHLVELRELRAENRWEDILALFHPLEEKAPELAASELSAPLRAELAFALGHLARYDEAIALYQQCLERQPDNFHYHAGLAYTAYDSLYAAKGRRIVMHPAERKARIELAHRHFQAAQALRPEGVTNYYRQGMLFKQVQNKKEQARPLFEQAVRNWSAYTEEERRERHQERKNYIKALFNLASCELDEGLPQKALRDLRRCIAEDQDPGFITLIHKHFALGKVCYHLGHLDEALQALTVAAAEASPEEDDYVFELMARVHLLRGDTAAAWQTVNRIPPRRRRPYVRWTEAEVLAARGEWQRAAKVLMEAAENDRRGAHKALLQLARLEFRQARFEQALQAALRAGQFFQQHYQNPCLDALFWQAAALFRLNRVAEAQAAADTLRQLQPHYPNLGKLRQLLAHNGE